MNEPSVLIAIMCLHMHKHIVCLSTGRELQKGAFVDNGSSVLLIHEIFYSNRFIVVIPSF